MKKLLSLLLLSSACAMAQNLPPASAASTDAPPAAPAHATPAPTSIAPDPSSAKARKLIDQMIEAMGGEKWLNYKTISQEGRKYSFYQGKPNSAGTLVWRFYQYPDLERDEYTKQRDVIYIYNGTKGYEKTYKGVAGEEQKLLDEVIRRRNHSLEVVVREWLKDPKTVLFYDGQSVADQQMVDMVTILNGNNDQVSIGLEIHSHLPISRKYSWRDQDKYKVEDETLYGNYRMVDGIATPYTITNKRDGEINGQSFYNKVEYNQSFAPNFFDATVTYDAAHFDPKAKKK